MTNVNIHTRQRERMTKQVVSIRLSDRTLNRIRKCLLEDERPSDLMRAAILRELIRRERNGNRK